MKENQEDDKVFDQERLKDQLELANMEVVDAEEVSPEDTVDVEVEEDKYPAMKNIPYVKIEDEEGNVLNPINGSYPSFFKNRRQRKADLRAMTKNPKNNKKGTRLVVTKLGDLDFTKAEVTLQNIKASKKPILNEELELEGWKYNKRRTLVHNQIKNN